MGFTRKIQLISLLIVLLPLIFATAIVTYIARDELFAEAQSRLVACFRTFPITCRPSAP